MDDISPIDLIDTDEVFDPQSWEHWGLVVLLIAFAIGGYIYVDRLSKRPKSHRYDRGTGKVEPIDED